MKDIFIDADAATKLPNPKNAEYIELACWLYKFDPANKENCAHLVVSQKLVIDYFRGCGNSAKKNSIAAIYNQLDIEKRVIKKSASEIKKFKESCFDQNLWDKLRCKRKGSNDPDHIVTVCLSNRQIALTEDNDLLHDLLNLNFRKCRFELKIKAAKKPSELPYK